MVDDFIERKWGRKAVVYDLPELKELLEETYGVIVYQEAGDADLQPPGGLLAGRR